MIHKGEYIPGNRTKDTSEILISDGHTLLRHHITKDNTINVATLRNGRGGMSFTYNYDNKRWYLVYQDKYITSNVGIGEDPYDGTLSYLAAYMLDHMEAQDLLSMINREPFLPIKGIKIDAPVYDISFIEDMESRLYNHSR